MKSLADMLIPASSPTTGRRFAEELDATDPGDTPGFRREIAELQNERSLLP